MLKRFSGRIFRRNDMGRGVDIDLTEVGRHILHRAVSKPADSRRQSVEFSPKFWPECRLRVQSTRVNSLPASRVSFGKQFRSPFKRFILSAAGPVKHGYRNFQLRFGGIGASCWMG